mgnify:CR=1 FL=1|jgi:hypothetical protein
MEQLYSALINEQGYNPSQAVPVLTSYYKISEDKAWEVAKGYHAQQATLERR